MHPRGTRGPRASGPRPSWGSLGGLGRCRKGLAGGRVRGRVISKVGAIGPWHPTRPGDEDTKKFFEILPTFVSNPRTWRFRARARHDGTPCAVSRSAQCRQRLFAERAIAWRLRRGRRGECSSSPAPSLGSWERISQGTRKAESRHLR